MRRTAAADRLTSQFLPGRLTDILIDWWITSLTLIYDTADWLTTHFFHLRIERLTGRSTETQRLVDWTTPILDWTLHHPLGHAHIGPRAYPNQTANQTSLYPPHMHPFIPYSQLLHTSGLHSIPINILLNYFMPDTFTPVHYERPSTKTFFYPPDIHSLTRYSQL